MADAKFSIGQVNITDYLRIIAREVTNPTADVFNQTYAPPQPTTRNVVISGLNPVMHYFDFYECSGPSDNPGTLLATFTIDVGLINQTALEFIEFVVDGTDAKDPASGTDTYVDSDLDGATYEVTQRGVGPRSFKTGEIKTVAGGGFQLLNGEKFNTRDHWFIVVAKTVTTKATVISKGFFTDVIEIDSDISLSSTHYNCMLEANGSATVFTATLPAIATIPEDTIFGFNTHFGDQRYLAVQLQSGENVRLGGSLKNIFWLGKAETIIIVKKGSLFKLFAGGDAYRDVGKKVKADVQPINGLAETGGWYNIDDVPRFFYEFVNNISIGNLSSFNATTKIVAEPAKFAIDTVLNKFWMPDTGGYFERNVDPNSDVDIDRTQKYTGSVQASAVQKHQHVLPYMENPDAVGGTPFGSLGFRNKAGNAGRDDDNDWWLSNDGTNITGGADTNAAGVIANETRATNVAVNAWRLI